MGKSVKTPPAPDPNAVAGAQTSQNISTAIANTWLGNANQNGPLGSTTTRQQTTKVKKIDPKTGKPVIGKDGKPVMVNKAVTKKVTDPNTGKTYEIPLMEQNVKLSKDQQALLDGQEKIGLGLNDMALDQVNRLDTHLSQPFSLDDLGEIGNFDEYQKKTEEALMSRMNPQLERDYNSLENRLVNQGLQRGTAAFDQAMKEHGQKSNDARTSVFLASGAEGRQALASDLAVRNQKIQERLTSRNQPINEITALMSGGQVSMPQGQGYNPGNIADTPIGSYIYQSANIDQQNATRQANANAAMWDAAGTMAGAGIYKWSDSRVKKNIRFVCQDETGVNWYAFHYLHQKDTDEPEFGVMAQELMDIHPERVHVRHGLFFVDYKGLKYA